MKKSLIVLSLVLACASHAAVLDQLGLDVIGIARSRHLDRFDKSYGLRVSYDITDRFATYFEATGGDRHGILVEDASVGVQMGLPFKVGKVQPYVIGSFGMTIPTYNEHASAGMGARLLLGKHCRIFSELQAEMSVKDGTGFKAIGGFGVRF